MKNKSFKALDRNPAVVQQTTATDFQGWSKMTLRIKTAYFSIFIKGFQKILWQSDVELHRQA